jgi:hypothetical protein
MSKRAPRNERQLGLELPQLGEAKLEPYAVPAPSTHAAEKFDPYPKGKKLEAGDMVTLIHRLGRVKRVRFGDVLRGRVHVAWPIANEPLEISVRTGRVTSPRAMKDWRLERNALEMARVAHGMRVLESKIAVE